MRAKRALQGGNNSPPQPPPSRLNRGLSLLQYKVVEVTVVTDEELEKAINTTVKEGWSLDGINFVKSQASKRPTMAFVLFTREAPDEGLS